MNRTQLRPNSVNKTSLRNNSVFTYQSLPR